jgi:hypothetical protein
MHLTKKRISVSHQTLVTVFNNSVKVSVELLVPCLSQSTYIKLDIFDAKDKSLCLTITETFVANIQ